MTLKRNTWTTESQDELTLLRNTGGATTAFLPVTILSDEAPVFVVGATQPSRSKPATRLFLLHSYLRFVCVGSFRANAAYFLDASPPFARSKERSLSRLVRLR